MRHINRSSDSVFVTVKPAGVKLLESFAYFCFHPAEVTFRTWIGKLPHPHKMLIGGNHDWVLQSLGPEEVQKMLQKYCGDSLIYLGELLFYSCLSFTASFPSACINFTLTSLMFRSRGSFSWPSQRIWLALWQLGKP